MNDIMKIIKTLENSDILLKEVSKTIKDETKEQRGGFLSMLLGTLGASLLGNLLTGGKGIMRAGEGSVASRTKGDGIVPAGSGSKKKLSLLLPFHPLTNIEIREYYKNEPRFNGVYSRNNLPNKIKKGAYVINLDEYENTGTPWVSLFVKANKVIYFDSFGIEHIPKYRLDEINKLRDYFNNEIKERKDIIKKLNKYLVSFDYLDKIFITLSASFGTLSIASQATVIGIPAGITGASLTLIFTIGTGISKSLLKVTKKRKKKHNKIIESAKSKLNTIDTLLSSALNDSEISHEEFSNIITEKNIYENIKENIKNTIEPTELPSIAELTARSSLERTRKKSTTL